MFSPVRAATARLPFSEVKSGPSLGSAASEKPRVGASGPRAPASKTPALATLERTPGWKALSPEVRRALTALLSGTSNPRSRRAAPEALRQPSRPGWDTASPQAQAKALTELLTSDAITPPQMKTESLPVPRKEAVHSLTDAAHEPAHQFHGATVDAQTRKLRVGDQEIDVVAPEGADLARVASLVSRLPPELRKQLNTISVNPVPNPDDEYWSKIYGQPVLAGMSCGTQGLLTIYPHGLEQTDDVFIRNLEHEVGHTLSMRAWGSDVKSPAWSKWRDAMAADVIAPSRYATASPAEDVAETISTYFLTRGTKAFDEYRAMMPARFAVLDELLSRPAAAAAPGPVAKAA